MLRLSSAFCPFCHTHALLASIYSPWASLRHASTVAKRKPSRMVLSPDVKRVSPRPLSAKPSSANEKPAAIRTRNGPFAGMNVTTVPRSLEVQKERTVARDQKRGALRSRGRSRQKDGKDPMKALKMQRALSNISYGKRGKVKAQIEKKNAFSDFGLLPIVHSSISSQALGGLEQVSPTPIQRVAIPALCGRGEKRRRSVSEKAGMEQFLLAAETGSGKTLAYLLPTIDAIKRMEQAEPDHQFQQQSEQKKKRGFASNPFELEAPPVEQPDLNTARPKVIILVPTSELVDQVGKLVKSLSHTVKYRSALVSRNYTGPVIRSRLFTTGGIDVVVSTPHLLASVTESDPNILSRVSHLVIDEADSLLDRSFAPTTSLIIERSAPSLRQLIFCSATIPRSLDSYLHDRWPDARRLVTPHLHSIPRRVRLNVVDIEKVPYHGNRDLACAQVIWDIGQEGEDTDEWQKKILVFVNEREKTVEVAAYLQGKGIDAVAMTRDSDARKNSDPLAEFTGSIAETARKDSRPSSRPQIEDPKPRSPASGRLANTKVLVTTDISSRGIDTTPVRTVVLYDVPHSSIDFIHRLGRVGRMNRRGRGIVLVGKKDRRDIVREVRDGMFKGVALI